MLSVQLQRLTNAICVCSLLPSYMIEQGICYLTLTDKGYPKRLAFLYLDELHEAFVQELQRDHGNDWRSQVETVSRPYGFIKFDKVSKSFC
jgi:vesicle transport protein SEC22